MTLLFLLVLVVALVVLFSIPSVPPLLRNVGAAVIFVVILWIILSMLGVVAPVRGGQLRIG
jgi:hypothetical protein